MINYKYSLTSTLLLAFTILLYNCNQKQPLPNENPLLGKWVKYNNVTSSLYFDNNKNAITYLRGRDWPGNGEINMKNSDGEYVPYIFGPLKYNYSLSGDTIHYQYYGSLNDKLWRRCSAIRDSNILHVWGYKGLPGIMNHVDEVGMYVLEGTKVSNRKTKTITIIIDEGHEGALHVAFNQPTGERPEYDINGNPIITVENGYIHKTTLKWDPRYMTKDAFDIKIRKCDSKEIVNINDYGHSQYRNLAMKMHQTDTVMIQNENFSLSAFSLGYNQYARDMIDYDFGEYINGQVASFTIGYLEDQYFYKDYIRKLEKNSTEIKD